MLKLTVKFIFSLIYLITFSFFFFGGGVISNIQDYKGGGQVKNF